VGTRKKTDKQLLAAGLRLADAFYSAHGNISRPRFKYYDSTHPSEVLMWELAVIAYAELTGTDLEDVLNNVRDEQ